MSGSVAGFGASVRRRRDGGVAIDLDLVHAGVMTEVVQQTRALLSGATEAAPRPSAPGPAGREAGAGSRGPGGPVDEGSGGSADQESGSSVDEEFAAIVSGLSDPEAVGEEVSEDPAVRRLLPDAHLDDPEASAEFRRLSTDTVRSRKLAAMDTVLADLTVLRRQKGGVVVDADGARSWLTALNDARLALGTRLAVSEDDDLDAELADYEARLLTDPEAAEEDDGSAARAYRIAVYGFLSELLELTVRALDR